MSDSNGGALASRNVRTIAHDGKTIHLVGTAHVSRASVTEVERLVAEVRPDSVCVELCASRYAALSDPDRWKRVDLFDVLRRGKPLFALASLAMAAYQRRLGRELGVAPGAELLAGIEAAQAIGAEVVLADRDVNVTLKRTWASLPPLKRVKLLAGVLGSLFERPARPGDATLDAAAVESLKDPANLDEMLRELARMFPEVRAPLIDERDRYLISKVREARGPTIVAVVGAGHVQGMIDHLATPVDRGALETLPPPRPSVRRWIIPVALIASLAPALVNGADLGAMAIAWTLPTSLGSGLATILTRARWQSILAAILCAPLATIHPRISTGMIVGPIEAGARSPEARDGERIESDLRTTSGFLRNRLTRTLIVALAATVGSAIGAVVGLAWVIAVAV